MKLKYRRLERGDKYHRGSCELLIRCSGYFEGYEGGMPGKESLREILGEVPEGYSPEDKVVMSIEAGGRTIGFADILRHYPDETVWMIGLLLIDPAFRGQGLGRLIHGDIAAMARRDRIKKLRIGVMEENHGGIRFWKRLGYKFLERTQAEFGGRARNILVMTRESDS